MKSAGNVRIETSEEHSPEVTCQGSLDGANRVLKVETWKTVPQPNNSIEVEVAIWVGP